MSKQPLNSVLLEKILNIASDMVEIKNHLKDLNGSVARHESILTKFGVIINIISGIGGVCVATLVAIGIKSIYG